MFPSKPGSPEDCNYIFPPFQTSRERQVEEEERKKSLLHLQLSHPTAPELMQQVNISSGWSRRTPETERERQ